MAINVEDGAARRDTGLRSRTISDNEPQIGCELRRAVPLDPIVDVIAGHGFFLLLPHILYAQLCGVGASAMPAQAQAAQTVTGQYEGQRPASHLAICAAIGGPNANW